MSEFAWVAAFVFAIGATARITRLFTWDKYPPMVWLRMKWDDLTNDGPWALLMHCGYCFGMWAGAVVVASGYLSDFHTAWWLVCGWLTISYFGATYMAHDGDDD
jgi:hypothetical protein